MKPQAPGTGGNNLSSSDNDLLVGISEVQCAVGRNFHPQNPQLGVPSHQVTQQCPPDARGSEGNLLPIYIKKSMPTSGSLNV